MNKLGIFAVMVVAGVSAGALAQAPAEGGGTMAERAPGKGVAANVVEITAWVQAIDKANRGVTIKGPRGRVETVTAGPEVKNFDQIKVGDSVVLRYVEALSLELTKDGTAPVARTDREAGGTAKPRDKPAAGAAHQTHSTAA